jgi:hypothetical protein
MEGVKEFRSWFCFVAAVCDIVGTVVAISLETGSHSNFDFFSALCLRRILFPSCFADLSFS